MTEYLINSSMWIVILGPEKTVLENRNSEQNHNLKVTFDFLDLPDEQPKFQRD